MAEVISQVNNDFSPLIFATLLYKLVRSVILNLASGTNIKISI